MTGDTDYLDANGFGMSGHGFSILPTPIRTRVFLRLVLNK